MSNTYQSPQKQPPSEIDYKRAILLTPGTMVTYRSFKQSTSKCLRGLLSHEFENIIRDFVTANVGNIYSVIAPGSSWQSKVFVKVIYTDYLPITNC